MVAVVACIGLIGAFPGVASAADTVTYPQDTSMVVNGVTLTILADSSHGGSLTVNASDFVLPAEILGSFTVRYTGSPAKRFVDAAFNTYCTYSAGNNDYAFTSAQEGLTISISASDCQAPSISSGGGGGSTAPYSNLVAPNGGQVLEPGSSYAITFNSGGSGVVVTEISLSTDGGLTYPTVITGTAGGISYDWTVPDIDTDTARIRIQGISYTGSVLVTDVSDADFSIDGTVPPAADTTDPDTTDTTDTDTPTTPTTPTAITEAEAAAPTTDSNTGGSYDPQSAEDNTPTINVDLDITEVTEVEAADPENPEKYLCPVGQLIKGSSQATVYYCGRDYKRYVFPNEKIFLTWYSDFSSLINITDAQLAQVTIGGNVTYKPGIRMIKIISDPKVYAVARGGTLRWVATEAIAAELYGANWNRMIDDVSDAFFFSYEIGDPVTSADTVL